MHCGKEKGAFCRSMYQGCGTNLTEVHRKLWAYLCCRTFSLSYTFVFLSPDCQLLWESLRRQSQLDRVLDTLINKTTRLVARIQAQTASEDGKGFVEKLRILPDAQASVSAQYSNKGKNRADACTLLVDTSELRFVCFLFFCFFFSFFSGIKFSKSSSLNC